MRESIWTLYTLAVLLQRVLAWEHLEGKELETTLGARDRTLVACKLLNDAFSSPYVLTYV